MDRRLHQAILSRAVPALAALLLCAAAAAGAADGVGERLQQLFGGAHDQDILDPERAFLLEVETAGPETLRARWDIVPGYYLYRDKFSYSISSGAAEVAQEALTLPRGEMKEDEVFGAVEVIVGQVEMLVPLRRAAGGELDITLAVGFQGCKDQAVCYPPSRRELPLTLPAWDGAAGAAPQSNVDAISSRLSDAGFIGSLLLFFGFGLALAFTPCVFPLLPILSGILVGRDGSVSHTPWRGLLVSLVYVLAMAAVYAVLGVVAGRFGLNLQAAAQAPAVLIAFSVVFVLLALSMFGLFELQLPPALQSRLAAWSGAGRAGSLHGAAIMGALSAIIVGPCVAPPLAGALLYIGRTGDAVLGGAALFAMGLGFGVPLLLLGASAGKLLPRAGAWMKQVRYAFGVIMLGVAVWLLSRILPGPATLVLWALLLLGSGMQLGALERSPAAGGMQRLLRGAGLALLVWAATLLVGAAAGGDDPLRPLARLGGAAAEHAALPFRRISDLPGLRIELDRAAAAGRPVLLDFYADWCIECKRMERNSFPDPRVRARLERFVLLQADVTDNDPASRELLRAHGLYGPPAILFFPPGAAELRAARVVGYLGPDEFLRHLEQVSGG